MQVILYDPKDPVFPPPHETVLDAEGGCRRKDEMEMLFRNWESRKSRERKHRDCREGRTKGQGFVETYWDATETKVCTGDKSCRVEGHDLWPCACCNWRDPAVQKARRVKKARLDAFLKTGKLPAGWLATEYPWGKSPWPKSPKFDERIHLPTFPRGWDPFRDGYYPGDQTLVDVVRKYLEAMGETFEENSNGYRVWTCGCVLYNEGGLKEACEKHVRALVTGAEED